MQVVLLSLLSLFLISGCAEFHQVLVNKDWKQIDCAGSGVGGDQILAAYIGKSICEKKLMEMGFQKIEDVEKSEPAKLEEETPPPEGLGMQPIWPIRSEWFYSQKGVQRGKIQYEVLKKDSYENLPVYLVRLSSGSGISDYYYSERLEVAAEMVGGSVTKAYTPPLRLIDWPLSVGKTWESKAREQSSTGKRNLHVKYDVRGFGKITVPAGTFDVFYILAKNDTERIRVAEYWYSPALKHYAKYAVYLTQGIVIVELVSYRMGE